jgi:uncharacterized protein YndB with AHSA1/START domain
MFKWLFGDKEKSGGSGSGDASRVKELLVVSRVVAATPERAFSVFVDDFAKWWPAQYTLSGDKLAEILIEAKMNGRAIERDKGGGETVWGAVLSCSRPSHLVLAWQIAPDRTVIDNEANASRVDVRFVAQEPDKTEVVLVHRDFPRHGAGWEKYLHRMSVKEGGWPLMMDRYAKAVAGEKL